MNNRLLPVTSLPHLEMNFQHPCGHISITHTLAESSPGCLDPAACHFCTWAEWRDMAGWAYPTSNSSCTSLETPNTRSDRCWESYSNKDVNKILTWRYHHGVTYIYNIIYNKHNLFACMKHYQKKHCKWLREGHRYSSVCVDIIYPGRIRHLFLYPENTVHVNCACVNQWHRMIKDCAMIIYSSVPWCPASHVVLGLKSIPGLLNEQLAQIFGQTKEPQEIFQFLQSVILDWRFLRAGWGAVGVEHITRNTRSWF